MEWRGDEKMIMIYELMLFVIMFFVSLIFSIIITGFLKSLEEMKK
jgi:hypothetical protein